MSATATTTAAPTGAGTGRLARHEFVVVAAQRGETGNEPADIFALAGAAVNAFSPVQTLHQQVEAVIAVLANVFVDWHRYPTSRLDEWNNCT